LGNEAKRRKQLIRSERLGFHYVGNVRNSLVAPVAYTSILYGLHSIARVAMVTLKSENAGLNKTAETVIIVKSPIVTPKEEINTLLPLFTCCVNAREDTCCWMESRQETPELPPKQLTPGQQ
jgi:hypothetical protein